MSAKNKYIVTTTIHHPTEAVERFDALPDWTLIVVGDQKTPSDYALTNGIYLSPAEQTALAPELSDLIGWNCIQRRNLGFVLALDLGADIVATIDDDNIPYTDWGQDILVGQTHSVRCFEAPNGCFDAIGATGHDHLWHRGYPRELLDSRDYSNSRQQTIKFDIQADFWDGDPDVDADCRMKHAPDIKFEPTDFPFASSKIGPFNSQNTLMTSDALRQYFVLPGIGRMDDIWASYHVQSLGYQVAFGKPTVKQERHPHDLARDFGQEELGRRLSGVLVASVNNGTYDPHDFWPERAQKAYEAYRRRWIGDFDHHRRAER